MMVHILFPLLLYGLGITLILFKGKHVPAVFFGWTAFAWGALLWTVAFILCLIFSIPYTAGNMILLMLTLFILLFILLRGQLRLPTGQDIKEIVLTAVLFLLTLLIANFFDLARASPDSVSQLIVASELANVPIDSQILTEFGYYGPMLAALHAPASWFGYAYITTLQAAFAMTMVGAFGYFCFCGLVHQKLPQLQARLVAILVSLFLFTTPFINFQFYYIHNNMAAAMYLLIGVGSLWWALINESKGFHWIGAIAFVGFSLTRTESVLFAFVFLGVALSREKLSNRDWLYSLLPFTIFLSVWQLWLLLVARPTTHILTPERILILLGAIGGFYVAVAIKNMPALNRLLIQRLHQIMLFVFALATAVMLIINPSHVVTSVQMTAVNLLTTGWLWWGMIWWILLVWLISFPYTSRIPEERLFTFGIIGYFLAVMVIGFAHGPGRPGWYSSPNRLYVHILPVILLYLTIKTGPLMMKEGVVGSMWQSRNE